MVPREFLAKQFKYFGGPNYSRLLRAYCKILVLKFEMQFNMFQYVDNFLTLMSIQFVISPLKGDLAIGYHGNTVHSNKHFNPYKVKFD